MFPTRWTSTRDCIRATSSKSITIIITRPTARRRSTAAISYAMMTLDGKQIPMYRFQPDAAEPAEYFDARAKSAKGLLMKTPVDGARISSGFGSRFHPILGYTPHA